MENVKNFYIDKVLEENNIKKYQMTLTRDINKILSNPSDYILIDINGKVVNDFVISKLNEIEDDISRIAFFAGQVHISIKKMRSPYTINIFSYYLLSMHEVWTIYDSFISHNNETINYSYSFIIDGIARYTADTSELIDANTFKISNLEYTMLDNFELNESLSTNQTATDILYTVKLKPTGCYQSNKHTFKINNFNRLLGLITQNPWLLQVIKK